MKRFFFCIVVAQCVFCVESRSGAVPKRLRHFVANINSSARSLQGVGVAILYKGRIVYELVDGKCRGSSGEITSTTLFPLASVSKSVVATAIALMMDEGRVDIDRKERLPWLRNSVNLKQLLSHTTGYYFTGNAQIESGMSRSAVLKVLQKQQPVCAVGPVHFYSNILFSLVEEVLERQHISLSVAVQELTARLGTKGIQIFPLESGSNIAYPHVRVGCRGKKRRTRSLQFPPYYPKTVPAAAGVFASLQGLIELLKLWCGHRPDLVMRKTLQPFYASCVSTNDNKRLRGSVLRKGKIRSYYGLGWRIFRAARYPGKDLIFHSGYIAGINTFLGFIPSEDVGIVILVNEDGKFARTKGLQFWAEFLR